jgi:hypothetical protein
MRAWLKAWWEGVYEPYENEPGSGVFFVGGWQKRHWTSNVAHAVFDFLKAEWKWAIGSAIAIAGLIMTYIRFF